jgi:pimeloyl-ACP methyl ester carboxylesterase
VPFTQAPRQIAWRDTPASYVICTEDLATPADAQRDRIAAGTRAIEFAAGHHPFLSRPDAFAELIAGDLQRAA